MLQRLAKALGVLVTALSEHHMPRSVLHRARAKAKQAGVVTCLTFLLSGCAASAPTLSPADYPFHSVALPPAEYPAAYPVPSVAPQIELHWRLTVDSNRVRADGLIERQQESQIKEVWLQLAGLDGTARAVSFTSPIRFAWRSPSALESFTIVLTPRGGEQRYEVRLYLFEFAPQLTGGPR